MTSHSTRGRREGGAPQQSTDRAEELARELFEQAPDALLVIDEAGLVTRANEQAEVLLGWRRDELIGQPVELLVPEALRARHVEDRRRFVADPERRPMGQGRELAARRRDGSEVPTEISLGPMRTAEGLLVVVALRDVTERRRAQREAERRRQEIERLNAELEAFVSAVTHDLRAPLRAIDGFTRRLLETRPGLDEEARRLLGVVRGRAADMRTLIEDLLRLSHVSQESLVWQRVDMPRLVTSVIGQLRRDGRETAAITVGPLPAVRGDEGLLRQVWVNYLDNALKYTGEEAAPQIDVSGWIAEREAVYRVRDNGAGFPMERAEHLFGVFHRLHPVERFPGSGVGLATARRAVHRHGGRVWAESEVEEGATFYFSLPAGEESAVADETTPRGAA